MDVINLKDRFGRRYRIAYEQSYYAEHGPNARIEDPWLLVIPCQHGEICPWGGENLAACTSKAGPVANKLKALAYTTVPQDGDDGANVVFPVKQFAEVARIMKPRRQRRGRSLSPAEKERLVRAGEKYRFGTGRQAPGAAQISTIRAVGAPEPVQQQLPLFDA